MMWRRRSANRCGWRHLAVVAMAIASVVAPCLLTPVPAAPVLGGRHTATTGEQPDRVPCAPEGLAPLTRGVESSIPEPLPDERSGRDEIERIETTDALAVSGQRRTADRCRRDAPPCSQARLLRIAAGRFTPPATIPAAPIIGLPTLLCRHLR
jgi:hypothetical protein